MNILEKGSKDRYHLTQNELTLCQFSVVVVDLSERLNQHIRKRFQRYHPTQNELTLCQFSVVVVEGTVKATLEK